MAATSKNSEKAAAPSANDKSSRAALYTKKFGVSTVMGAAVGVAARRLTSDALYGAGLFFVGLQGMSYLGYVTINWNYMGEQFQRAVDQNDDGKVDMEDVKIFFKRVMSFLTQGLPDAAGFISGFFFGAKYLA